MTDTIFARITGAGRAAIATLRLSGPEAGSVLRQLAGGLPEPRVASLRRLRDSAGTTLDHALVLWMPGPGSFTGEDCAEISVHGGRAVVDAVSTALAVAGARAAEPGEFSRRAFTHGKLDLLQAEAVADLVDAETEAQRRQALGQLEGGVSRRYGDWRGRLINALALIEAEIDFPDEDLPGALSWRAEPILAGLEEELSSTLKDAGRGQRVREGYRIALVGAPNAGKSSLFNALLGRGAAIISARPGTTRDVLEAPIIVGGLSAVLADTAGVRLAEEEIEIEGVRRAQAWARSAALRLLVGDPAEPDSLDAFERIWQDGDILVLSKADVSRPGIQTRDWARQRGLTTVTTSVIDPGGLDELRALIGSRLCRDLGSAEQPAVTRERHERAIRVAVDALRDARAALGEAPDRAAEDVRRAALALQSVVGRLDREAVLDEVFSAFCIGK